MESRISIFLLVFLAFIVTECRAAVFKFEWTGTVSEVVDRYSDPATLPGVEADDWFVATIIYDTADFGPGIATLPVPDRLEYAAPAGLQMNINFASGGEYTKDITRVVAVRHTYWDQWNVAGGESDNLLFQANDDTLDSYILPLPGDFDAMHAQFVNSQSKLVPSSGNQMEFTPGEPADMRFVSLVDQAYTVTPVENSVQDILDFMDSAIEVGDLAGTGPGRSAANRLIAVRNMIVNAGELIDMGFVEEACTQLNDIYLKCDDLESPDSPPDFIYGPAASELAAMILDIIADLGCS